MMFSTYILPSGSLGLLATFFAPELVPVAVAAGMIGDSRRTSTCSRNTGKTGTDRSSTSSSQQRRGGGALYFFISDRVLQMIEGYDRFSEFFKYLIGLGPEVSSSQGKAP
jgi:hypothetical protein